VDFVVPPFAFATGEAIVVPDLSQRFAYQVVIKKVPWLLHWLNDAADATTGTFSATNIITPSVVMIVLIFAFIVFILSYP
jgi:hypothetical protein